jgi:glycogen operon protein
MFNAGAETIDFHLPRMPTGAQWQLAADTSRDASHDPFVSGEESVWQDPRTYRLNSRSSAVLLAR